MMMMMELLATHDDEVETEEIKLRWFAPWFVETLVLHVTFFVYVPLVIPFCRVRMTRGF